MTIFDRFLDAFNLSAAKIGNKKGFFSIFRKQEDSYLEILYDVLKIEGYANNFGKGHLYVCPNNHIYIIGKSF